MNVQEQPKQGGWFQSNVTTWVLLGFLAVAAFYLITEHTAHVLGFLPYVLFLLCPLMMLFMHGRHGGHDQHSGHDQQPPEGGRQ